MIRSAQAVRPEHERRLDLFGTSVRILVGGPEVTSAFVLMGLALARQAMRRTAG